MMNFEIVFRNNRRSKIFIFSSQDLKFNTLLSDNFIVFNSLFQLRKKHKFSVTYPIHRKKPEQLKSRTDLYYRVSMAVPLSQREKILHRAEVKAKYSRGQIKISGG